MARLRLSLRYFRGDREIPIPFAVFFIILTTWQRASSKHRWSTQGGGVFHWFPR